MVATSPDRQSPPSTSSSTPGPKVKAKRRSKPGVETRAKIIEATLETVLSEGLVGTSARAIAREGDLNQALVFYHFGSIEELLLEALEYANARRLAQFGSRLGAAENLADLLVIAECLFGTESGVDNAAVAAIIGGWPRNSEVGERVMKILEPWEAQVESALQRCLAGTHCARLLPTEDLTYVISSMVFGVEMMRRVDAGDRRAESVLATLKKAAAL